MGPPQHCICHESTQTVLITAQVCIRRHWRRWRVAGLMLVALALVVTACTSRGPAAKGTTSRPSRMTARSSARLDDLAGPVAGLIALPPNVDWGPPRSYDMSSDPDRRIVYDLQQGATTCRLPGVAGGIRW